MARKREYASKAKINKCTLTNIDGETIDIVPLIGSIRITESINQLYAIYDIFVADAVVLLEKYGIIGNEKIDLEITDYYNTVTKKLAVIGIREYTKPNNESQSYRIQAMCETALLSSAKRISRAVNGTPTQIIQDLYSEIEFNLPLIPFDSTSQGNFKGVIPNLTYTDTFAYLLSKSYNDSGTTFHMFETFWFGLWLSSYDRMVQSGSTLEYRLSSDLNLQNTDADYDAIVSKITKIDSNIGLSTFDSFRNGAFKARNYDVDVSTKTYTLSDFYINDSSTPKLSKDRVISDNYEIAGTSLGDIENPKIYMSHRNTKAYDGAENFNNGNDLAVPIKRGTFNNMFAIGHNITVPGYSAIYCSACVDLWLPKPTDPSAKGENRDELMSGKYVVTQVQHTIYANSEYSMDIVVRKDSVDRNSMINKYRNL
jgi:hypothetical protein